MRSNTFGLRTLVLPFGAGPNDPAIVLTSGNMIPPELIAYYAGFGQTVVSVEVFRLDATNYDYQALVTGGGVPFMAVGTVSAGTVHEMWTVFTNAGIGQLGLGSGGAGNVFVAPTSTLSVRTGADFLLHGDYTEFRAEGINAVGTAGTTTSAAYVNLPGNPSISIDKDGDASDDRLRITMTAGGFSSLANTGVQFGVNISGGTGDVDIALFNYNTANVHASVSATRYVNIGAGSFTITGRWKRYVGAGTLSINADDQVAIDAMVVGI